MMPRHVVFLGAPTRGSVLKSSQLEHNPPEDYKWTSTVVNQYAATTTALDEISVYRLPPATMEEASRRISRLYENIIFKDIEGPEEEDAITAEQSRDGYIQDPTTVITWPPTLADGGGDSQSRAVDRPDITFLRPTGSLTRYSMRHGQAQDTQETQETNSLSYSLNDSSDASVARFPTFQFSLHSLTSLASLSNHRSVAYAAEPQLEAPRGGKQKVNVLVAVLEAEGPDTIRITKGHEAGKEVSLLKIVVGDEDGQVCRLTAWREVAERWGGALPNETSVKRGDVVHLQNILASRDASDPNTSPTVSLTASPTLNSTMLICYRTMPRLPDREVGINDERFRPDLRLGYSDAAVRKVANVVKWFQAIAGLPVGE